MSDPYSISALVISGITAIGTIIVHYNFKHCKSACCESDCFNLQEQTQTMPTNATTINYRNNSPIIIQQEPIYLSERQSTPPVHCDRHLTPPILVHHGDR